MLYLNTNGNISKWPFGNIGKRNFQRLKKYLTSRTYNSARETNSSEWKGETEKWPKNLFPTMQMLFVVSQLLAYSKLLK